MSEEDFELKITVENKDGVMTRCFTPAEVSKRPDVVGLLFRRALAETCLKLNFDEKNMAVVGRMVTPPGVLEGMAAEVAENEEE